MSNFCSKYISDVICSFTSLDFLAISKSGAIHRQPNVMNNSISGFILIA